MPIIHKEDRGKMMKIEIHLWILGDAGGYDLVVRDNGITETLKLVLSPGQPRNGAYREAELLAVALDCELYNNNVLVREAKPREGQ